MKWEMGSGAWTGFCGCLGRTEHWDRGQLGYFSPGLGVWGLLCPKTYSLVGVKNLNMSRQQCPRCVHCPGKAVFQSSVAKLEPFTFIYSVGRTNWRNGILCPPFCHFLVHDLHPLSFVICALQAVMSPDLPQVTLSWDSSYGRKLNISTFRLLKSLAVLVRSQVTSP